MNDESKIFGITVRAFLAIVLVLAACYLMITMKEIEKLFGLAMMALGFYFGQKSVPNQPPGGPDAKISSTSTVITRVDPAPDKGSGGQSVGS